ncbi:glycogenin glucosyltransferase [Aspergillus fumigatus]
MVPDGSSVYCTLLLSDNYLPGAVVLAHSLRDNGTKAKLVALYTPDTLQYATIKELQTVYDEIIPVQTATNRTPANLWLMDRPDLIATFTKIELWRQTQFRKIVYIDCDVVAVRAPDELLTLEEDFAAAPDVGWPDIFNSGVMVLRPNLQDYYALKALAERGISFDGADQGLLNMHFRNWHRLSFTYNCTPSANYQYIPAYKHFQSTISLIHFIGAQKPWNLPRQVLPVDSPYNQLLGRWWAIYDRHYRPVVTVGFDVLYCDTFPSATFIAHDASGSRTLPAE